MNGTEEFRPNPFRQLVRAALIGAVPRSLLMASLPARDRGVALTFDDGPHPEHTPRILDALAEHSARATFFVVGEAAVRHPQIVQRIVAEGHSVGHHSWSHSEPGATSASQLLAETRRCRDYLEQLLGCATPLFRPPHGKLTPGKLLGLWRQGNVIVLWNCDTKDYQMTDAAQFIAWPATHTLDAGDIVLLHDTHAHTASGLPALLASTRVRCQPITVR